MIHNKPLSGIFVLSSLNFLLSLQKPEEVHMPGNYREVPVSHTGEPMTGSQGVFAEAFWKSGLPQCWVRGLKPRNCHAVSFMS